MPDTFEDDAALLAAFQGVAMTKFDHVARYARWLTNDDVDADDLVQETYLKALRGWRTFQIGSDCRAWLFTICRNTHIGQRRRGDRVVAVDAPELEALAARGVFQNARATGLEGIFDQFDLRDAIQRELRGLPDVFREAVVLVDLQDMSYQDAAQLLDVPVGTVRSRLFRGRRLLQQQLLTHAHDAGYGHAVT